MRLKSILLLLLFSISASAHNVTEHDGYYQVDHSWLYNGKTCSISLNISKHLYSYFRNDREHLAYRYQFNEGEMAPNYYGFMLSEHDRPVMRALAEEFARGFVSEKDRVGLALSFVQSIPYAFDSDSKGKDEYVRYPIETLVDGCGDCEDKVALLAAILYEMDVDFILLVLPEHMAVGVHCDGVDARRYLLFEGKRFYYMETTMTGWQLGDIPEDYYAAEIEAVPVDDTPRLLIKGVRFESQPTFVFEKATCTLQVDLHNLGPRKATEVLIHIQIIDHGNRRNSLLADEYYHLADLQEGELRTEKLSLWSLIKENCVLQVELMCAEVDTQYYEVAIEYSRTREY